MEKENVIEISNLTKKYESYTAVDRLDLSISKGEIFGLLGPNGAGKSTTMLMLMGLTERDSGQVKVCNIDPGRQPIEVKRKVGYLPEDIGFYEDLTGLENLIYTARLNGASESRANEKACELLDRVGLTEQKNKKTGKYSRGMRQRLGLADALIKNPEVIILDEPTLGIDPAGVRDFLELIVRLSKEDKITTLFSSHHLHQVQQVCDRVGIFVNGKLLAEGNVGTLANQLFNTSGYTIEAKVATASIQKNGMSISTASMETLVYQLKSLKGIKEVQVKDHNLLLMECDQDMSSEAAKIIVNSGCELNYLNQKQYGLDDVYHKYFEGTVTDETKL